MNFSKSAAVWGDPATSLNRAVAGFMGMVRNWGGGVCSEGLGLWWGRASC
ncbi:hypothetical protein VB712_13955 [Spirulina sp. CCNP1310]|nr:hypothetical protein [Spirulina sp. CCNP1310]MEA5420331.1 hypothetical protein [Spirulina sp. CCNP1310]